jgi:hypothetical protein
VRVTDVVGAKLASCEFGEERVTHETELDDSPIGSARTETLIHYG